MKTLSITLAVLLVSTALFSQDKPAKQKAGVPLFTIQLHQKPKSTGIDTVAAEITVIHKVGNHKSPQTFIGWVVQNGNKKKFYSEAWDPMPSYYVVSNVKELN